MAKVAFVFEEPKTCSDCYFLGAICYIRDHDFDESLYRRIANCKIAPRSVDDPFKEVSWLCNNKPDWCPLKPVKED